MKYFITLILLSAQTWSFFSYAEIAYTEKESDIRDISLMITPEQWQYARTFLEEHGNGIDDRFLERNSKANQAMTLGSSLWIQSENNGNAEDTLLGQKLMLLAAGLITNKTENTETISKLSQGYLFDMVAKTYQKQNNYDRAEYYFNKSIALEYEDACVNLGVMWELQQKYKKAKKVYHDCLPQLASHLLYSNLGTLYYNGLGGEKESEIGAAYWQKSYALFPFDSDINYNLGVYNFYMTHNYAQARYHFSYCSWHDQDCARVLANRKLIKHNSEREYLQDILRLKKRFQREYLLEDRLQYAFDTRIYFDATYQDGLIFHYQKSSDKPNQVSNVAVTFPAKQYERALLMLNRLVYIDTFAALNLTMLNVKEAANEQLNTEFIHLKQHHKLQFDKGIGTYSITFVD